MATNNAIDAPIPFAVPKGGIGSDGSGFSANSIITTGVTGTSPLLSVGPGTAGDVLTSNGAGVAPTFQPGGGGGGANTALSNLAAVAINESLISDTDITDDLGSQATRWRSLFTSTIETGALAADTLEIGAWDVDGAVFVPFITMTADNVPTGALSGDITGVTQGTADNSTKLATTAYVDAATGGGSGANIQLSNLGVTSINAALIADADDTEDLGTQAIRWHSIFATSLQTGDTSGDLLQIGSWDVDGAVFVPFMTFTALNTPTAEFSGDITGVTQAPADNSTKLATTAYVDAAVPVSGANTALSNLASVAINTTLVSDTDVTDNLGTQAIRWNNVYSATVQTGDTAGDTLQLGAWDVDGAAFVPFITFTANNTTTGVIASAMTATTQTPADNSTKIATTAYADAAAAAVAVTFPIPLSKGGTNANLTANNGGIFYSTAAAGAILAGTATATQMLQSGTSAAPAWSTTTWPATSTVNQLLFSSATNTITGLATANSSMLVTSAGGVPSLSTTIPNGMIATTQAAADNSTKVATTAYVDAAVGGANIPWTTTVGTTQALAVNHGYVLNNAGLVTATLPAVAAVGDRIPIRGLGAGGWLIAQNASQIIHVNATASTTGVGGSIASTNRYDNGDLQCIVANNEWIFFGCGGNITVV